MSGAGGIDHGFRFGCACRALSSGGTFTNDATTGIGSAGRTGTGVNFNGSTATVNGVSFQGSGSSGTLAGVGYTLTTNGSTFSGNNNASLSGNITTLTSTFLYGGTETLALTSLTANHQYALTEYNSAFGNPGTRLENISDSQGNSFQIDENATPGNIFQDVFTAGSTGNLTLTYVPNDGTNTYHQYDFQLTDVSSGIWNGAASGNLSGGDLNFGTPGSSTTLSAAAASTGGTVFFNDNNLSGTQITNTTLTTAANVTTGTLQFNNNAVNYTLNSGAGVISGNASIVKVGSGKLTIAGNNTYTGVTALNGGTINLGSAETVGTSGPLGASVYANPGSIVLGGGTLQYSSSNNNDYSGRFSTVANQAYKIDTNGQNVTFATALTSSGGCLTKIGNGTLTLASTSTYTGRQRSAAVH